MTGCCRSSQSAPTILLISLLLLCSTRTGQSFGALPPDFSALARSSRPSGRADASLRQPTCISKRCTPTRLTVSTATQTAAAVAGTAATSDVTTSEADVGPDQQHYDELLRWALLDNDNNAAAANGTGVAIRPSKVGRGFGLFATRPHAAGDVLFAVPLSKCLTLRGARAHPSLGKYLAIMAEEQQGGQMAALASYLAAEMLGEAVAEWRGSDAASDFSPYLRILPARRGMCGQDHVLWWDDTETDEAFVWGSPEHEEVLAVQDWAEEAQEVTFGMMANDLASRDEALSVGRVGDTVRAAFVCVLSRAVEDETSTSEDDDDHDGDDDDESGPSMVPVLDMARHSSTPNIRYWTDTASSGGCASGDNGGGQGRIVVEALTDLAAGQELTIEYTSRELDDHEFFVMFGFVPGEGVELEENSSPGYQLQPMFLWAMEGEGGGVID